MSNYCSDCSLKDMATLECNCKPMSGSGEGKATSIDLSKSCTYICLSDSLNSSNNKQMTVSPTEMVLSNAASGR